MNKLKAPQREESINIFALDRHNDFLVLTPDQQNLHVVQGKHLLNANSIQDHFQVTQRLSIIEIQEISTSPSISFNINKLLFSSTCKNLCVVGENSCVIIEITPRCRAHILREHETIYCRCALLLSK